MNEILRNYNAGLIAFGKSGWVYSNSQNYGDLDADLDTLTTSCNGYTSNVTSGTGEIKGTAWQVGTEETFDNIGSNGGNAANVLNFSEESCSTAYEYACCS